MINRIFKIGKMEFMKFDYGLLLFVFTVLTALFAYAKNVDSDKQLNRMENYDSLNLRLGEEIKNLSNINNSIAGRIDTIVTENKLLTQQNIALSNKANELIEEVKKLSIISNDLIERVDVRTEKTTLENALMGEIILKNSAPLRDDEILTVNVGGMSFGNSVLSYKSNDPPKNIFINGKDLIPLKVINGAVKISAKVYDLSGNWIVEIKDNKWTRNPNNTGKFEYDDSGFEIVDNRGFTALSINLDSRTNISIEGYLLDIRTSELFISGNMTFRTSINRPLKQIIELLEKANIRKLFPRANK
jgi:hypothetical protein